MNKLVIQSDETKLCLVVDHNENGSEHIKWTSDPRDATGFYCDEEAVNTLKRHGIFGATVRHLGYGPNSG
jgi:hypothetical protein